MPWIRPTLAELVARIEADLAARLLDGMTPARRSSLGVLARVQAGAVHLLHGFLEWASRQLLPDTAEAEYLERHAAIHGLLRKGAVAAIGPVTFAGTVGATIPAGTELQRADGQLYTLQADVTFTATTATGTVLASTKGGASNAAQATQLTLTTPVAGVQSAAQVGPQGLAGGTDAEADAPFRARLLQRLQEPPHGGSSHDYKAWALEVPGVTRAYVYPRHMGAGTVGVAILADGAPTKPLPGAQLVAEAQAHIDGLRPVTAEVFVFAPTTLPVTVRIRLTPDSIAARQTVQAELEDLFLREAEPGRPLLLSHIREAVSVAPGEFDHQLLAPAADVAPGATVLPVLGPVEWVTV